MATIEERAHQYGCNAAGGHYQGGMRGAVYDANKSAYIEIATEQREIDVDKACEWLLNRGVGNSETFISIFRKAMEE